MNRIIVILIYISLIWGSNVCGQTKPSTKIQSTQSVAKLAPPEIIIQKGYHEDMEFCLSPDGKYIVESGQYLSIYDTETGIEIKQIYNSKPGLILYMPVMSPNNKYLAAFDYSPEIWGYVKYTTVSIFDVLTGQKVSEADMGQRAPLLFSKDNQSLYCIGSSFVKWDFKSNTVTKVFLETFTKDSYNEEETVSAFCLDKDSKRVAIGLKDRIVVNSTVPNSPPEARKYIEIKGNRPAAMVFSKDNSTLLCAVNEIDSQFSYFVAIDIATGTVKIKNTFPEGNRFYRDFSSYNTTEWVLLNKEITVTKDVKNNDYYLLNLNTGLLDSSKYERTGMGVHYLTAKISPDGKRVFSRRGNRSIYQYSYSDAAIVKEYAKQKASLIHSIEFSHDGKNLIISQELNAKPGDDTQSAIFVWDVKNVKQVNSYSISKSRTYPKIGVANNSNQFVMSMSPEKETNVYYRIYNTDSHDYKESNFVKFIYAYSSNGKYWAEDLDINDKDTLTPKWISENNDGYSEVSLIYGKPYSRWWHSHTRMSSYGFQIMDRENKKMMKKVYYPNSINSGSFTPDGKHFVVSYQIFTGDIGTWIDIFSTETWRLVSKRKISDKPEFKGCFSPDGKYFATATSNSYITCFDAVTWQPVKKFEYGYMLSTKFDFSPDGTLMVTGGKDCKVTIWDVEKATPIYTIINTLPNKWVAFTPDNYFDSHIDEKNAAAASFDGKGLNIDQMAVWYNRPDILLERIGNADKDLIGFYKKKYQARLKKLGLNPANTPSSINFPVSEIVSKKIEGKNVTLTLNFTSSGEPLKSYNIFVNDVPLFGIKGKPLLGKVKQVTENFELNAGSNKIEVSCVNQSGMESFRAYTQEDNQFNYKTVISNIGAGIAYSSGLRLYDEILKVDNILFASEEKLSNYAIPQREYLFKIKRGADTLEIKVNKTEPKFSYSLESKPIKALYNLYFLAFGVSKYSDSKLNLAFADKDALDLSSVADGLKGKSFANVYTKVLTNEQVNPAAIKAAKDFVKNAKPDDTFILFIAGHGMHDKDAEATYYFLTSNADINNLKGTAADFETIEDLLQGIPPRNKLFLMDACESGEIDEEDQGQMIAAATGVGIASRGFKTATKSTVNNAQPTIAKRSYLYQKDRYIYNDLVRRSGAIVFSSSKGGELSYERSDIENGLFTEYIMKALTTTVADKDGNGTVSTDELRVYVSEQVAKASGDLQHPTVDRDNIHQKFGFQIK